MIFLSFAMEHSVFPSHYTNLDERPGESVYAPKISWVSSAFRRAIQVIKENQDTWLLNQTNPAHSTFSWDSRILMQNIENTQQCQACSSKLSAIVPKLIVLITLFTWRWMCSNFTHISFILSKIYRSAATIRCWASNTCSCSSPMSSNPTKLSQ